MAPVGSGPGPSPNPRPDNTEDIRQAYRDIACAEQTATFFEANLTSLESKLNELLALLDVDPSEESMPSSNTICTTEASLGSDEDEAGAGSHSNASG